MAAVHAPSPKRFSREEFYRLGEQGFLDERTELVDGELIQMPPIGPEHVTVCAIIRRFLEKSLAPGFHIREGVPLDLGSSQPQPDLAVVAGMPENFRAFHPSTAILVIEVSQSSLEYDRDTKASIYARAGVGEYWIVDVAAREVLIFASPADGVYSKSAMASLGDRVDSAAVRGFGFEVSALF